MVIRTAHIVWVDDIHGFGAALYPCHNQYFGAMGTQSPVMFSQYSRSYFGLLRMILKKHSRCKCCRK